jgi:hypothetical protein
MARLSLLWIIHTTSSLPNADTENRFRLNVRASPFPLPNGTWIRIDFPDIPSPDEREANATDQYRFDYRRRSPPIEMSLLDGSDIEIEIRDDDAWLPSSIWAIGQDADGARRLIAGHPTWPTSITNGWFSTDTSEGRRARRLG